jgi:hypothetical protein
MQFTPAGGYQRERLRDRELLREVDRPPALARLELPFRDDDLLALFLVLVLARPSERRFLFTVAAAIALARFEDRPLLLALSLMCSY